jgi:hypothetical protein
MRTDAVGLIIWNELDMLDFLSVVGATLGNTPQQQCENSDNKKLLLFHNAIIIKVIVYLFMTK